MTLKRLRRAGFSRFVAKALCALLLTPQLLALSTRRALAQQTQHQTVIVIDFNNRTGVGGALLGRRAASAMSLQLRQSDLWDPVSQSDVDRKIADLHLTPPFDKVALQTLARSLDATAVLTGDVTSVRVSQNPAQATVRMVVRLMDVGSGELINGAVATGTASHIGLESAQDVLLDEALSKAAFQARQSMERTQLPEGTVLNTTVVGGGTAPSAQGTSPEDALLNVGARQGVRRGMQFVVLRGRELVGYVSATSVDADKTVARVTQNFRGVKPEDKVRAIYVLPEGAEAGDSSAQPQPGQVVTPDVQGTRRSRHRSLTGPLRILFGLVLAAGIFALAARKGGTTTPFNIAARSARALGVADPAMSAAIQITWARPREVTANAVDRYQVYRVDPLNPTPVLIAVAFDSDRRALDTTAGGSVVNFYNATGGAGGDPGSLVTTPQMFPGIMPGRSYRYYVQTIFQIGVELGGGTTGGTTGGTGGTTGGTGGATGGGGGTTASGLRISDPSPVAGPATAIVAPTPTAPANNATVTLGSVTFTWTSVAGADVYSIQVSADPTNPNSFVEVAQALNPSRTAGQTISRTIDLSRRFAGRTLLVYRIGARSSADKNVPVDGFVFSNPLAVTPQ